MGIRVWWRSCRERGLTVHVMSAVTMHDSYYLLRICRLWRTSVKISNLDLLRCAASSGTSSKQAKGWTPHVEQRCFTMAEHQHALRYLDEWNLA